MKSTKNYSELCNTSLNKLQPNKQFNVNKPAILVIWMSLLFSNKLMAIR